MAAMGVLLLLLLSLPATTATTRSHQGSRALQVSIHPVRAPATQPFDASLSLASPDISLEKRGPGCEQPEQVQVYELVHHHYLHRSSRLPLECLACHHAATIGSQRVCHSLDTSPHAARYPHCCSPLLARQVHLTYWSSTSLLVSWASCDPTLAGQPGSTAQATNTDGIRSVVFFGSSSDALQHTAEGVATSYANTYAAPGMSYASPVLHHVLLTGALHSRPMHSSCAGWDAHTP